MTLKENINKMQEIAYKADRDFSTARTELASAIVERQQELTLLTQTLSAATVANVISTFNAETVSLFQQKFKTIDSAFDSVVESGKMSEEAFSSLGLSEIGINNTNMRTEYESTGITWPLAFEETTSISTLSRSGRVWVDWPDDCKVKACNEGNLPFLKHTDGAFYPIWMNSYSNHFVMYLDKSETGEETIYSEIGKVWYNVLPDSEDIYYYQDPEQTSNSCLLRKRSNINMTGCTEMSSGQPGLLPITIGPFYRCYANWGETLFNFTNLLNGTFGSNPVTSGLDDKLVIRGKTSADQKAAAGMITWFKTEASEYTTPSTITSKITNARALEQATSLYAAKFAILKILYGHIRRLTK